MRRISASRIFTLAGPPLVNGVITVDNTGTITGISEGGAERTGQETTEHYQGILVPGFVNCHCHLELSHLRGKIASHRGIPHFIGEINHKRNAPEEEILLAAEEAEREMALGGTVAAGDVSNNTLTATIKSKSSIAWHTFVEVFGFHPLRAEKAMKSAIQTRHTFNDLGLPASIVPHSPYSVSDKLFSLIAGLSEVESRILSIHNQESDDENRFYRDGTGPILEHLQKNLGLETSYWHPPGKTPPVSCLPKLPAKKPLLLVHNTFMSSDDLRVIDQIRPYRNTWLVLCPNSNLYIGNHLPPVGLFRTGRLPLCLGTDSLASNYSLSVFEEMKTLHLNFPEIPFEELLSWGCHNGAMALKLDHLVGTLVTGKKPGIVLITGTDPEKPVLTSGSRALRLV